MAGSNRTNITTQSTFIIKEGVGTLKRICINKGTALGVITIYDNTAGSGTVIGTATQPAALLQTYGVLEYDANFNTGLTIVTSGASQDITVVWE